MMTIFGVLVFVLVQGRAVCDEVYPISLLEGFFVNQSEWHARDHTEPLQVKSMRPRFSETDCSRSISRIAKEAVDWITKCIVDEYNFEANKDEDEWISQPDFKDVLETLTFGRRAAQVQAFFEVWNNWDDTKKSFGNTALLMITAARYLLVTSILYTQSSIPKLTPCSKSQEGKYVIPLKGVCYPAPYGSASYKSDYDVGLIGTESGSLTEKFNKYFQTNFNKPSEFVFDTNVYAFTLEFAIPSLFINLPWNFQPQVTDDEKTDNFKIQELVSAYFKVFKYNKKFAQTLVNKAYATISVDLRKKLLMEEWINQYKTMKMTLAYFKNSQELREVHNREYGKIVNSMSQANPTPYQPQFLDLLSKALIYAAEAYHTRGAIRHVVGAIQMKWIDESLRTSLSTNDLWVSMIENWGEANKEYNHCEDEVLGYKSIRKCFLLMSKYMWRVLDAMRLLQERLPETYAKKVRFSPCIDPQCIMKMWLRYKKKGNTALMGSKDEENVRVFLKEFGCKEAKEANVMGSEFTLDCLEKIHEKVWGYNSIMSYLFVQKPSKLLRK